MHNEQGIYDKLRPPKPTPASEICGCSGQKPIKLMSTFSFNPIHCLDCNLEVPPERINLGIKLAEAIAFWSQTFRAIYHLWLDADYEDWAERELSDINSSVNRRGREIAKALNDLRRCYYWYHQDQSVDFFEPVISCPLCGKELTKYADSIFQQGICGECSIVTVGE
jgi:predicted  nucleic acid-binding Zn ribbon protein